MPKPNNACELIAPENIELNTPYTFNLSHSENTGNILKDYKTYETLCTESFYVNLGIEYELFFELSARGRLHLHGNIVFRTVIGIARFYQQIFNVLKVCRVEIDTIEDPFKWREYLCKQQCIMKPYLNGMKLKYCLSNKELHKAVNKKYDGVHDDNIGDHIAE